MFNYTFNLITKAISIKKSPNFQCYLAKLYYQGAGVEKNITYALETFKKYQFEFIC